MMAREKVVQRLCKAATKGMVAAAKKEKSVSSSDIFSAYMNLAKRAVMYFRDNGANVDALREAAEDIWRELPPEKAH